MPRALFSVSDKTNLETLARGLAELGWDLVASGGTARQLSELKIDVVPIERVTNSPEMLGGRVKTLHPAIHAGILARDEVSDFEELKQVGYAPIDVVVCNLYPFQKVSHQPHVTEAEAIENIDIGGVTLLRGAAKNYNRVTVIVDPSDYTPVLAEIQQNGRVSLDLRRHLALKAFAHTRDYDAAVTAYLTTGSNLEQELSDTFTLTVKQTQELRYGENPHQKAGFFAESATIEPLNGKLLAGKPLSYNNILDADAAWRAICPFNPTKDAAVAIIKHLTPTGVALGENLADAFMPALKSDELSAFGGVIAVNRTIDEPFVEALGSLFIEVIIAPDYQEDAFIKLSEGRKNCRLIKMGQSNFGLPRLEFRSVLGGALIQETDAGDPPTTSWQVVSQRRPTDSETKALEFAWKVVQQVKSNAIVIAHERATVGIGGGLSSRVDAVNLAVEKAGERVKGAVLASDAFFPFPDGVEAAAKAGVTAIIQPGGALRDQKVIDAANEANITMIFTNVRHFRH